MGRLHYHPRFNLTTCYLFLLLIKHYFCESINQKSFLHWPFSKMTRPAYLQDYVCNLSDSSCFFLSSQTFLRIVHSLTNFLSYHFFSPKHFAFLTSVSKNVYDHQLFSQPIFFPHWQVAMVGEIKALETNHTWILSSLPLGKKAIACKWIYETKLYVD